MAQPQHYRTIQFASPHDGPPDPTIVSSVSHTLLLFFDRLDAAFLAVEYSPPAPLPLAEHGQYRAETTTWALLPRRDLPMQDPWSSSRCR